MRLINIDFIILVIWLIGGLNLLATDRPDQIYIFALLSWICLIGSLIEKYLENR